MTERRTVVNTHRILIAITALALVITGVGIAAPVTTAVVAHEFYAAPTGSGSACSLAAPCSLTGVRDKVRTVAPTMTGDVIVNLRGGTYWLTEPLVLDASDSGRNGHTVIWRAFESETPTISGGRDLSGGWTLVDSAKNIYRKSGVTATFRHLWAGPTEPVVAGERSREPDLGDLANLGPYLRVLGTDTVAETFRIDAAAIAAWSDLANVELVNQPHWYHHRLRVAGYTTDSQYAYVSFRSPESDFAFTHPSHFHADSAFYWENSYEFLDKPGEWYLNRVTDELFYIPRAGQDLSTAKVVAGTTPRLLTIAGTTTAPAHDIEITGLTFTHTGWDAPSASGLVASQGARPINGISVPEAVRVAYATNIRISDNTFTRLAAEAVSFAVGVKDSRIVGNTIRWTGASAIVLDDRAGKNPPAAEQTESILVANNRLDRIGKIYDNGTAILAYFVKDTTIEHNTISDTSYTAIQVGGQAGGNIDVGMSSNIIRYNDIHHFMQVHDDGGGVYTLARQPGTMVFENWIHDYARSPWTSTYPIAGVYLDNYSEFITVECNAIDGIGSTATATYEQTGNGAQNNTWTLDCGNEAAVRSNAGVQPDYVEP